MYLASEVISRMKYDDGHNYIFGYHMDNTVAIPFDRKRGEFLDVQDPKGRWVQRGLRDVAKTKGEGFYEYIWLNFATNKLETKYSYVKYFKPFDWWFGTGVYVDSLKAIVRAAFVRHAIIFSVVIVLIGIVIFLLVDKLIVQRLVKINDLIQKVESGSLSDSVIASKAMSKDEIDSVFENVRKIIDKQSELLKGATKSKR